MKRTLECSVQVLKRATRESPLISVVLPTFNRVALLPESIESILNQTERNFELIVVDDGSSDGTGETVGRYADKDERITHVRQQNLGLPSALNNGFRLAHGEFFTWTSDDNRYLPEAFGILSRELRENPEVGLVFAEMLRRRAGGLVYQPNRRPEKLWEYNKFGGAFMYRRSVAERIGGYDVALTLAEDYDYFLRLSRSAPIRHVPYVVYEYREHDESLTNRRRADQAHALEALLRKHLHARGVARWQLSRLAVSVAGAYRRTGLLWNAWCLAWTACWLWPFNWRSYRSVALVLASYFRRSSRSNGDKS